MSSILLISCCGEKLATPAPARDLYRSQLFRLARAYAEACGLPWLILSARHGAIAPDQVLEPYDQRLPARRIDRVQWGTMVAEQLLQLAHGDRLQLVSLCGAAYTDTLEAAIERAGGAIAHPLRGLGIGQRLAWLAARRSIEGCAQ